MSSEAPDWSLVDVPEDVVWSLGCLLRTIISLGKHGFWFGKDTKIIEPEFGYGKFDADELFGAPKRVVDRKLIQTW